MSSLTLLATVLYRSAAGAVVKTRFAFLRQTIQYAVVMRFKLGIHMHGAEYDFSVFEYILSLFMFGL